MKTNFAFLLAVKCVLSSRLFAQIPPSWTVNSNDYAYSMTITAKANVAYVELADDNNVIAAFVNNECRGVVHTNTTVGTTKLGLLVVYSNTSGTEKVYFKIYSSTPNAVYDVVDSMVFNNGDQIGGLSTPYVMYTIHPPTDIDLSIPLPLTTYLSPNDDGKNDFLIIDNVEKYNSFSLQILDQYGDVVYFKEKNYANDWDGRLNGKALPTGNYYYIFKNSKKIYKGNITIIN